MNLQSISQPGHPTRRAAAPDDIAVGELTLERLGSEREIAAISYLRDEIDLPAAALCDPGFRALEKRDEEGIVGVLRWRGSVVGTLRLVPMQKGLTPLEKHLPQHAQARQDLLQNSWEFGRLVLDPAWRSGPELVRRCVFLGAQYLAQHTDALNIFASCTPVLARLYRRFGFSVLTSSVAVQGSEKSYALIHATVTQVLSASGDHQA